MANPRWLDESGDIVTPEDFGTSTDDSSISVGNTARNPELVTVTGGLKGTQGKFIVPCVLLYPPAGVDVLTGLIVSRLSAGAGNPVGQDTGEVFFVVVMFQGEDITGWSAESGPHDSGDSTYCRISFAAVIPANPLATKYRIYFRSTAGVVIAGEPVNYQEYTKEEIVALGYVIVINTLANSLIPAKYEIRTFDYEDFDTEEACAYYYHQEDPMPGRQITVSRVRIVYRDIGAFTAKATILTAQQQSEEAVDSTNPRNWQQRTLGGRNDKKLYTDYFDIIVTGERPQLVISREANSGPLAIISTSLITDVEIMEQV